jgi:hypothetical protein
MSKTYKHKDLKSLLWKAAQAPTVQEFDAVIEEMREVVCTMVIDDGRQAALG